MVALNEPAAALPVDPREVEAARLAFQGAVFLKCLRLAALYEFAASLSLRMQAREQLSLHSLWKFFRS